MNGRSSSVARVLGTALVVFAAACGEDSGPGEWTVTARADGGVGAVVVEISGQGIEQVTGAGNTRVFANPSGDATTRRVIGVSSGGGTVDFVVSVLDVATGAPTVTAREATSTSNQAVSPAAVSVSISRR